MYFATALHTRFLSLAIFPVLRPSCAAIVCSHQFAVSSFYGCANMKMQKPSRTTVKQMAAVIEVNWTSRKKEAAAIWRCR